MKTTNDTNKSKMCTYLIETVKHVEDNINEVKTTVNLYVHDMARDIIVSEVGPRFCDNISVRNTKTNDLLVLTAQDFVEWKKNVAIETVSDFVITSNSPVHRLNGDDYIDVVEYTYEIREMPAPSNRNKANLCLLEVYNTKNNQLLERKYFEEFQHMDNWARSAFHTSYEAKRNCRIVMNGVDVTAAYDYKTRSAYSRGYDAYTKARHTSYSIVFDKMHEDRVSRIGIVPREHGENTEFKCCFCGKTFTSPNARHYNGGVRPEFDEEGNPNYCCTKCFKHYVVTTYVFRLQGVFDDRPDYKHIPRGFPDKYNAYLQTLSIEELDELIKKEGLLKMIPSGLSTMDTMITFSQKEHKKREMRKARAAERARERREETKAAKLATKETK